jgi:SagB-type dehydrogenase family enzyme
MWVTWASGVEATLFGADATVESTEGSTLLLPAGASAVEHLREILVEPVPLQELEHSLSRIVSNESARGLLANLLNEQLLEVTDGTRSLSQLHLQTVSGGAGQNIPSLLGDASMTRRQFSDHTPIELPEEWPAAKTLNECLRERRSCWDFSGKPATLGQIGAILFASAAAGANGPPNAKAIGSPAANRTYPSGGALYPVEILIYAVNVIGTRPGFYYYSSMGHKLLRASDRTLSPNTFQLPEAQKLTSIGFVVLFFIDFLRQSLQKYGPKIYRLALLEGGHIAQNMILAASALDLASLPICGFEDAELTDAAGLRYPEQPVVYALAIGERQRG